ncbi:glycosyl transferase [Candidatus Shapirobacteria bacterium CG_4_9_14_0_2_um_filter_39_11]|uniref:Glycosyl transferase n=1 Tax=Candidatus Shapirobacteria bacterium CG_4_9_14_0_2_um_filter_39_11 TaxID=1974478 RepID=A0A2M8ETK2_9BACT|nr:MAG: glycosyl transferase [Candidatus Shapirobacteria bacterium CG_4_9_14_0_2_um_filter_39_11]
MKIAILSSIHWRTPPKKYGPWELIASYITEGMVKKGHEVTLYASGDSQTKACLRWVCPRPICEDPTLEPKVYQYLHSALVFEEANEYDIIHNHYDAYPLVFSKLVKTPVVTTLHGFSSSQVTEIYKKYSNTFYISISYADRKHAPDLNYIANIYHGIPVNEYEFNNKPENYFCFLGRISPDKGVHLAVKLAKKLGIKLKIAGLLIKEEEEFFNTQIKPNLNQNIQYLGLIDNKEKKKLLKNALGFLHLNTYSEGFGLTLVEAMASGTPVIGMNLGSIPEIIEDNKTGFVISDTREAIEAIKKIDKIERKVCRERVEKFFSLDRMIDEYEQIYHKILSLNRK